jgi:hypothetical protein
LRARPSRRAGAARVTIRDLVERVLARDAVRQRAAGKASLD